MLEAAGLYEAVGAKHAQLPCNLLEQVAAAGRGVERQGQYYRWEQIPVAGNAVLQVRLRDEEYFKPHRAYALKQLTRDDRKKSAAISTLELPSNGFDDVRPPDSMWSRIGVYHWPQVFYTWIEGAHLYVRKMFNGDEIRKLNADAWEFFDNHPKARVFHPTDVIRVTLFTKGAPSPGILTKFLHLRRGYALQAVFRMVDIDQDEFDGARYVTEALPCIYVELEGTSRMTRLMGRLSLKSMCAAIEKYLPKK
jgi:hypothetical protein